MLTIPLTALPIIVVARPCPLIGSVSSAHIAFSPTVSDPCRPSSSLSPCAMARTKRAAVSVGGRAAAQRHRVSPATPRAPLAAAPSDTAKVNTGAVGQAVAAESACAAGAVTSPVASSRGSGSTTPRQAATAASCSWASVSAVEGAPERARSTPSRCGSSASATRTSACRKGNQPKGTTPRGAAGPGETPAVSPGAAGPSRAPTAVSGAAGPSGAPTVAPLDMLPMIYDFDIFANEYRQHPHDCAGRQLSWRTGTSCRERRHRLAVTCCGRRDDGRRAQALTGGGAASSGGVCWRRCDPFRRRRLCLLPPELLRQGARGGLRGRRQWRQPQRRCPIHPLSLLL